MIELTDLEEKVMLACRHTDYGDCYDNGQWSFAVCDAAGLSAKVYGGVVASLIKKGLVVIYDNEGNGRELDMVFSLTEAGRAWFDERESASGMPEALSIFLASYLSNEAAVEVWDWLDSNPRAVSDMIALIAKSHPAIKSDPK